MKKANFNDCNYKLQVSKYKMKRIIWILGCYVDVQ